MNVGQWIVIALSAVMGVWFGIASFYNRRRGIATYRWISQGLKHIGKISEQSWIGSSGTGARLVVAKADAPFHRVETVFLLESREIMPLWLFNRVRNKQDEMILKAGLRSVPVEEIEVAPDKDRQLRALLVEDQKRPFEEVAAPDGFVIAHRGRETGDEYEKLKAFVTRYPAALKRISIQRKTPHLLLRVNLPPLTQEQPEDFFDALANLVR